MNEPFAGVARAYLDANVFIYFVEGLEEFQSRAAAALEAMDRQKTRAITSELAVAECLYGSGRQGKHGLELKYRSIFQETGLVDVMPVTVAVFERAARLGGSTGLKLLDCIHFAAAELAGCEAFVTNDTRFRSKRSLKVVHLSSTF